MMFQLGFGSFFFFVKLRFNQRVNYYGEIINYFIESSIPPEGNPLYRLYCIYGNGRYIARFPKTSIRRPF